MTWEPTFEELNLYSTNLHFPNFCETQPPASIGWVALSSVVRVFVPHRWHLLSSPLYDVSEHTNHISDDQMIILTRWWDDQMARWPYNQLIRWPDDQRTLWPEEQMTRRPDDQMTMMNTNCPDDQMTTLTKWPEHNIEKMTRWSEDKMTRWPYWPDDQMTIWTDDQIWQSPWYWILTMISHDFNIYHNSLGMWSISCQKNIKK